MKNINLLINPLEKKSHINKEIYGHFTEHLGRCIYDGIYVGEDSDIPNIRGFRKDIVEAFRELKVPVIRWPGGNFADTYHWSDGIGPKDKRPEVLNDSWGNVVDNNGFGTHEFFDFCELVGAEPYLAGNIASGTVKELADWIEYITFDGKSPMADLRRKNGREKPWKLKYLGIGNEAYGSGGNLQAQHYADEFRRYSTFCRNFNGNELVKVACGYSEIWNKTLLENLERDYAPDLIKGLSIHYYTILGNDFSFKGSATDFTQEEYYEGISKTQQLDTTIRRNKEMLDIYDPDKNIGIFMDEWGCWYDVEPDTNPAFLYQQNTIRDAIIAANYLNIFNSHSDRVVMANLAQAVNVLQSVLLTDGDRMIKTPTYHVMDMFKTHMEAELLYSYMDNEKECGINTLSHSVSMKDGKIFITIANASLQTSYNVACEIPYVKASNVRCRVLTGEVHEYNSFDLPDKLMAVEGTVEICDGKVSFDCPSCSVVAVEIETKNNI